MKRILVLVVLASFFSGALAQQKVKKVVTINGSKYFSDEFVYLYNKNNTAENKESIDEYLQRFVDYKLKLTEALEQRLDTSKAFKKELDGYKRQVTSAYKVENWILDSLVAKTYERMRTEVEVQHLFVKVPQDAKDDTPYKMRIDSLRKLITEGADFSELAAKHSDERGAKERKGMIGYITASKLPFDFETLIYETPTGQVSEAFRSPSGFHLFKALNRREARGQRKIAHIFKYLPNDSATAVSLKDSMALIDAALKDGADFSKVSEDFSDDESTKGKGGALPWFSAGEMVKPIEDAAFALKDTGMITGPIKSRYGWHYIKLIGKKRLQSFDVLKYSLRTKIELSPRFGAGTNYYLEKLKKKIGFEQVRPVSEFYEVVDDSIFSGKWKAEQAKELTKVFFKVGSQEFNQTEFTEFLKARQGKMRRMPVRVFVDNMFKQFTNDKVKAYINSHILDENPKLERLLEEYHDGILIFELLQEQVWAKAQKDSVGLQQFFDQNRDKYKWENRVDVTVLEGKSLDQLNKAKALMEKNPNFTLQQMVDSLGAGGDSLVVLHRKKYENDDDAFVATIINAYENNDKHKLEVDAGSGKLYFVHDFIKATNKELKETRGLVVADYQDKLEKEWVEALRKKYKVKVHKKGLKLVKKLVKE